MTGGRYPPIRVSQSPSPGVKLTRIVDKMLRALTVHTYLENGLMYPEARKRAEDERFDVKTAVLIESVTHHIEEEGQEWFLKVREVLGRKKLQEIGEDMLKAKKNALQRPEPPGSLKKAVDAVLDLTSRGARVHA